MTAATIDNKRNARSFGPLELAPITQTAPTVPAPDFTASRSESPAPHVFAFTGTGSEYFRIWVVNVLLTILTFGIYSAWAKVRRLQYFYRNTRVADAVFDYHGDPKAILKGRMLALVLGVAYKISYDVSAVAAIIVALIVAAITPWLLARSFRFKMANSSYRGLRFRFRGTVADAYRNLILFPVVLAIAGLFAWSLVISFSRRPSLGVILLAVAVTLVALGATVPLAHYCLKRFQHENADFGQTAFYFQAKPVEFFRIYGRAAGLFLLGAIPAAIFGYLTSGIFGYLMKTAFGWLFAMLYGLASTYASYLFVRPFLESRIQNLVWNHTELGPHRFESRASARRLLWIHASNLALIMLTVGLYKPFAVVRIAKYRVESMTLLPDGGLEDFHADPEADNVGATGQEAGEFFDIDIAL